MLAVSDLFLSISREQAYFCISKNEIKHISPEIFGEGLRFHAISAILLIFRYNLPARSDTISLAISRGHSARRRPDHALGPCCALDVESTHSALGSAAKLRLLAARSRNAT